MCMTRIIFSGIGCIRYLCPDDIGGMVQRRHDMPPIFLQLTMRQQQRWGVADCPAELRQRAFDTWNDSREALDAAVVKRSAVR